MSQHLLDMLNHRKEVSAGMALFIAELATRSAFHDESKLSPAELPVFEEATKKLKGLTYGSDEYKAQLSAMKPALDHHYANNRHHPEHFENGINGMNLVDLIEMFCDWQASVKRHADGDIMRSIEVNQDRFGMSEQLVQIFKNTLDMMK
jgi:hypothetical protein